MLEERQALPATCVLQLQGKLQDFNVTCDEQNFIELTGVCGNVLSAFVAMPHTVFAKGSQWRMMHLMHASCTMHDQLKS